jgi:hypothetical protein
VVRVSLDRTDNGVSGEGGTAMESHGIIFTLLAWLASIAG